MLAALKVCMDELRKSDQAFVELTVKVQMIETKNFKVKNFENIIQRTKESMESLEDIKQKANRTIGK